MLHGIRRAQYDDAAALARLSGALGYPSSDDQMRHRLHALQQTGRDDIFVATDEAGDIAGWIHVGIRLALETDSFAEILGLVVDERQRQCGIGRALVRHAEAWARQQGIHRIRVRSNMVRTNAHAFYERLGYTGIKQQAVFDLTLEEGNSRVM